MDNWVPEEIVKITKLVEGYVVGGAVRDHLLGKPVYDYDIATPFIPSKVEEVLHENGYKAILTGVKYGTVSTVVEGLERPVEITTYRQEFYSPEKGRFPDVAYHLNRENDLMRRDFTINAMAYDAIKNEIIDPHGGMQDIMDGRIRFVGVGTERIREDPLRMVRACRIAATLGFKVEDSSSKALWAMREYLSTISQDRMVMEVKKANIYLVPFLKNLLRHELTEYVLGYDFRNTMFTMHDKRGGHYGESVYTHILNALRRADDMKWYDFPLRLAILFHDVGKTLTRSVENGKIMFINHEIVSANIFNETLGSYTGLENKTKKQIEFLIENHMRFPLFESKKKIIRETLDWKIEGVPWEWIENLGKLAYCDRDMSFEPLVKKMKKVWNVPRPDGKDFLHFEVDKRKYAIREAWIQKAHDTIYF